jgi:hypothetical protein
MAQEYKITSIKKGNEWSSDYGTFQSYALAVEGIGEPVQLNKKVPVSQEPQVGDSLYGTMQELVSKAGKPYYRFKGEKRPDTPKQYQDNSGSITLGMVWKTLIGIVGVPENTTDKAKFWEMVTDHTNELLSISDNIKNPSSEKKFLRNWESLGKKDEVVDVGDEPISMDDIPF